MKLQGEKLASELRKACDNCKKRFWIAVPFIGNWFDVERIIGNEWLKNKKLNIRILTDIRNESLIHLDTYQRFKQRSEIRTLTGLHAKVFIIDNQVLLTSANLTGTAFQKRFEIGSLENVERKVIRIYNDWWNKADPVNPNWNPLKRKNEKGDKVDPHYHGLKRINKLPAPPTKFSSKEEIKLEELAVKLKEKTERNFEVWRLRKKVCDPTATIYFVEYMNHRVDWSNSNRFRYTYKAPRIVRIITEDLKTKKGTLERNRVYINGSKRGKDNLRISNYETGEIIRDFKKKDDIFYDDEFFNDEFFMDNLIKRQ